MAGHRCSRVLILTQRPPGGEAGAPGWRLSRSSPLPVGAPREVELIRQRCAPSATTAAEARDWATSLTGRREESGMSEFRPGLEGVVAFETEIAEPDRQGGSLRYRGVDSEDLVGHVTFGHVWGLLVDNAFPPGLAPAEPYPVPVHSGDIRVDVQSAVAMLAPAWGMRPLLDISDQQARDDLARASVMALSFVAQAARGPARPAIPQERVDESGNIVERFMIRWQGDPDPRHVKAVDAYWTSAAEHGMNASTFTARVIASTGADVAAAMFGAVDAQWTRHHGGVACQ